MSDPGSAGGAAPVLQCDPLLGFQAAREEIEAAVARVLASGAYILGPEVDAFEREFAHWSGAASAVGCANGTDALVLALRALGVGPGATVVTVSHTAVATVAAIELTGAAPLLIDVDPDTFTMDPEELATVLASAPAGLPPIGAVVPVHLYGQPAEMGLICEAAARAGVVVVEDCAQAHGAALRDRGVGQWGAAAAYSFYPTKNLGAFGDGGAVTTGDEAVARRLRRLRQYGWEGERTSVEPGMNSRLDELQAAILRVKLSSLDADNHRRGRIADLYDAGLAGAAILPRRAPESTHVFHQYVIRRPDRGPLQARLRERGVLTAVHYPVPVHLQPAFRDRVALGPSRCRATERLAGEILSLPMHPQLSDGDVDRVCATMRDA